MDKEEQKPITLPDDLTLSIPDGTALFSINEEGSILGSYKGVFSLRCYLSPLDTLAAGRHFRDLLGQFGADAAEGDRFIAFCTSQLAKRVLKGPPWWNINGNLGDVPDLNVLSIILDRALTAEAAYKQALKNKKEEALEKALAAAQALHESLNPKKEEEK